MVMNDSEKRELRAELDEERRQREEREESRMTATERQVRGPQATSREREARQKAYQVEVRGDRPLTATERQVAALFDDDNAVTAPRPPAEPPRAAPVTPRAKRPARMTSSGAVRD